MGLDRICGGRAIQTPTNQAVDQVNSQVMSTFRPQEPLVQLLSHDMVGPDHDHDAWLIDFQNAQEMWGLPPLKLDVKVGCPIILM